MMLKSKLSGYNGVADNTGLYSFVQLIAVQGHIKSSILVSIENSYVTSYSH